MTCVSLRSGIASSGIVFIDHTPAITATVTTRNTTKRFRAENSMMALITVVSFMRGGRPARGRDGGAVLMLRGAHATGGGFQLTLGVDQESARRHHPLAGRQTFGDGDAIVEAF